MPTPTSYSWAMVIQNAVPIGDAITMQTPGMTEPTNYDTENAEVVYGGEVLHSEEFTLDWADDFTSVVITNESDEEWPVQDTIALAVAGVPFDASGLQEAFTQIMARLTAVETRSVNNETAVADHEARITTLEGSGLLPHVTSQSFDGISIATMPDAIAADTYVTMVATNNPTSWAIASETRNGIATPNFWNVNDQGQVRFTSAGLPGLTPGDVVICNLRATNDVGSGDGSVTMNLVA